MKAKTFVFVTLMLLPLYVLIYVLLFFYQLNAPVGASYWVDSLYKYKEYRMSKLDAPRLIIVGGSNVLFGINTEEVEKSTGYKVINFGVHAGMDFDYIYYRLKKNIHKGDIVVMPLEYSYYS